MTSPANVFVVVPPEGKQPTGYAALVNEDGTPWLPEGTPGPQGPEGPEGPQGPQGPAGEDAEITPAAYVDPDTGTVADVVNALIAAGLMAGGD